VDSIFAQSLAPTEVVIVDDCSGDATLLALQKLERTHQGKIKIVQMKANGGAASARNAGWDIATQPYIAFLDADDSWHPHKLQIQYEYMRNNPNIALCGHRSTWLRDDTTPPPLAKDITITSVSARSLLFKNAFSTPTVMVKRDIPFRFVEGQRYAEDAFLWQQIAFFGLAVVRIESALAYIHKAPYGSAGLSARLWRMEQAELVNFVSHYQAKRIGFCLLVVVAIVSCAKHLRRVFIGPRAK
jgi:glycosyltransferase involved in cell wall biosynthesis